METILRCVILYAFLWVLLRASGKRTFAQMTTFEFLVVLLISEASQQALVGNDYSLVNAMIAVATLLGIEIALSLVKQKSKKAEHVLDDTPVFLVKGGRFVEEIGRKERVDEDDVLEAAREQFGLHSLDDVGYAVLEKTGDISIIPRRKRRR